MSERAKGKHTPGRAPERLKIDQNWKDAAKKAMAKGKPPAPAKKKTPRGE